MIAAREIPVVSAPDWAATRGGVTILRVCSHETFRKSDSARISCDQRRAGGTFSNA
jgi:hypothetical protein